VEIYRPLALDPKDNRRKRAKLQSSVKTAESVLVPPYEAPEHMPE